MKAARLNAPGTDFVIEDVPVPTPGPGQVLIRIAGAGACHSDLHTKTGEQQAIKLPLTLGHENAGWIESFGPGAEGQGFEVGDAVVVFGGWGCGHCRFCLGGQEQLCNLFLWGGMGPEGGYAEYLVVPSVRELLHADGLDPVTAAPLTDAALTPYSAVKKTLPYLVPGTSAVLIGAGGLGQYGVQFFKLLSPATLIVVDTDEQKRETARSLGADHVIDPRDADAAEQIKAITGEDGAAAVVDFVGIDATMALGAGAVGRDGLFVLVGLAGGSFPFSFFSLPSNAAMMTSNWGTRNELEEVLALARSGRLVSNIEQYPLSEINEVFQRLATGKIPGRAVLVP
ncbi:NAD(P)-dependent alcohol dehydrogenase [Curtobacterium sp. MCBD17_034]|uniref:NAD(P)-dependent alcohol dehydrogenase n=1 Tax=unclassified Curtobacterium TaxID=257496 RepID=UPI000DA9FB72|nr:MULTISPECIES: NAD(P)-dependent alcohol dehydrogenase [unclassified Curtobacterium]PZF56411.1 NAD(P)-dependent alcohol dehydrogenase [Curtobacterium sp. MCBD17_034]PZM33279.1 NAD(P)-dependent alcohol dehydrogenase [Curtobacterium sp. MCBD17_031]